MRFAYLNGDFIPESKAKVSVFDRGFMFGDGVYEVILAYDGRPFRLREHLNRLEQSLSEIHIHNPHTQKEWDNIIAQLMERNLSVSQTPDQKIYLQVTRGVADCRDHNIPSEIQPTSLLLTSDVKMKSIQEMSKGLKVATVEDIRWKRCDIKTTALLGHVMLNYQAQAAGADEAVILYDGVLCEGSKSNIFVVKDGTVFTPEKNTKMLGGITRDYVIKVIQYCGIAFSEKQIHEQELLDADEIWVTSTSSEVLPAIEINGQRVGNGEAGPLWHQVAIAYKEHLFSE